MDEHEHKYISYSIKDNSPTTSEAVTNLVNLLNKGYEVIDNFFYNETKESFYILIKHSHEIDDITGKEMN